MVTGSNPLACLCRFSPDAPASSHSPKTGICLWIVVYFCILALQWVYPMADGIGRVFPLQNCMNLPLFHRSVSVSAASDQGPEWGNAFKIAGLFIYFWQWGWEPEPVVPLIGCWLLMTSSQWQHFFPLFYCFSLCADGEKVATVLLSTLTSMLCVKDFFFNYMLTYKTYKKNRTVQCNA